MWLEWLPWRYLIRSFARGGGFIDPVALLSALERFSHPSEVSEPIELLRAGVVFHARGLINTKAIQHNLDWIWPYWVERQFNPHDHSFIPRAFSITHVNLTHRNWTAVGLPGCDEYVLVDPRGLVTVNYDGWSLDFWIVDTAGRDLLPSRAPAAAQKYLSGERLEVVTNLAERGMQLSARVFMEHKEGLRAVVELAAESVEEAGLAVSIRPYNPEGISFVRRIETDAPMRSWLINQETALRFSAAPARIVFSNYREGDVYGRLALPDERRSVSCDVGLATAAAVYRLPAGSAQQLRIEADLDHEGAPPRAWAPVLAQACRFQAPDDRFVELCGQALAALILLSPHDVYPGSFTYKRFWFRDAAFMLNALLCMGYLKEARRAIARFFPRQTADGYFRSQEGEWDSNGEALWIVDRYSALSGDSAFPDGWCDAIERGARWIGAKRIRSGPTPQRGLLPAGFSAEHFGPNDYYYWDDFWGVAGLRAASRLLERAGRRKAARRAAAEAEDLLRCTQKSAEQARSLNLRRAIPAAPYRRMDAGAVGVLAASYPLQLYPPDEPGLLATTRFLLERCLVQGAFFQDMVHSGINAYLTLHLAQVLLRSGDRRFIDLVTAVAGFASETGQWPEAIHPLSGGGCMGDGQHGWAAAEWLMMARNMFVREEGQGLILASGIPASWTDRDGQLACGPTVTPFGPVSVQISIAGDEAVVRWHGQWRTQAPPIQVQLEGWNGPAAFGAPEAVFRRGARA